MRFKHPCWWWITNFFLPRRRSHWVEQTSDGPFYVSSTPFSSERLPEIQRPSTHVQPNEGFLYSTLPGCLMQNSRRRSKAIGGNAVVAKAVQTQNSPSRSVSFGGARTDEQLSSIQSWTENTACSAGGDICEACGGERGEFLYHVASP